MKWHNQSGNITTNIKVEVNFTLPELSTKMTRCRNVMWMNLLDTDMV